MDRKDFVQILRYDVNHKWKKNKKKVRSVLEELEFPEIDGRLTPDEVRHIFGDTELYGHTRLTCNTGKELLLVCRTCGRYSKLRWYYEDLPDINTLWKTLLVGKKLYSPKDNLLECMVNKHEIEIRWYEELEAIKQIRKDLKETQEIDSVISMMESI